METPPALTPVTAEEPLQEVALGPPGRDRARSAFARVGRLPRRRLRRQVPGRAGRPGSGTGVWPLSAVRMKRLQTSTGRLPPDTRFVGVAVVVAEPDAGDEEPVKPTNQASRKSWLVPVLPAIPSPGLAPCAPCR